jgi:hypothetical protein
LLRPELLSRAESYARRAVTMVKDSYSLTSLGVVLLAKAAYSDEAVLSAYYDDAVDQFEAAHDLEVSNLVTSSWMAYLRHSLPVLERMMAIETTDDLQERIVDDWLRFYSQVSAVARPATPPTATCAPCAANSKPLRPARCSDNHLDSHDP